MVPKRLWRPLHGKLGIFNSLCPPCAPGPALSRGPNPCPEWGCRGAAGHPSRGCPGAAAPLGAAQEHRPQAGLPLGTGPARGCPGAPAPLGAADPGTAAVGAGRAAELPGPPARQRRRRLEPALRAARRRRQGLSAGRTLRARSGRALRRDTHPGYGLLRCLDRPSPRGLIILPSPASLDVASCRERHHPHVFGFRFVGGPGNIIPVF